MKKLVACFALASLLALGGSAVAELGTIDDVPAATLLLPYFEVDLSGDAAGVTTLFSINNASAAPALVHVVVWTDLSVHVLDFNVYLTGYDVWTQNLRDLLINGTSPQTEHFNNGNAISPVGEYSLVTNPETGVGPGTTSCNQYLPYDLQILNATYIDHVQRTLTGLSSPVFFGGLCSGYEYGDEVARGYITMDNVSQCSVDFPGDLGYFIDGGNGLAVNVNQLWGDYFHVDQGQNFAQGETLVHIEADDTLGIDNYTFYRRYTLNGEDNREGLGSTFAVRYINGGGFDGGTDLSVWRDSKWDVDPFSCALSSPNPFPLGNDQIVIFDEDENPVVPEGCQISPCPLDPTLIPFPFETQRVEVGGTSFPVPFNFGWLYLNLNSAVAGSVVPFEPIMQNWVSANMDANGRFSVGFDAIQLDNVTYGTTSIVLPVQVAD